MATVERTELAPGYSISRVIHGGWQFSEGHRLSEEDLDDAVEVLVASAQLGVTTFDCADIYTGVEALFGRFLRRWRTTSTGTLPIQIHTKLVPDDSDLSRVDRRYVERIVDRSLQRLGVERLDLVQFYWWRDEVPGMEDVVLWMDELRAAGKIRHVAVTNLDVPRLRRIETTGVRPVSDQVQYSALDRRPAGRLAGHCRSRGIEMIAFGTLAGGFLTDRWLGVDEPTRLANRSLVKYRLIIREFGGWEAYQALLATLSEIAGRHGVETGAVAIRFVLQEPAVAAVVLGATRLGQMERNVRAFDFRLSEEERSRIRVHTDAAPGPAGDVFELERDRRGPHGRIMKYDLNRE